MLKQKVGFGWVKKKKRRKKKQKKVGFSVDYPTFNLMYKSWDKNFSIPNKLQTKAFALGLQMPLSVTKC